MKREKALAYLLVGALLALAAGCGKPAVRGYPPSPVYEKPSPQVETPSEAETKAPSETESKTPSDSGDRLIAAVIPLEKKATGYMANGDLERAEATAERALRISPNDARLWCLMAEIQLARENWSQAEQFAAKSNLLAGSDSGLRAKNWRTIAEALRRKNMSRESKQALEKARRLESK